MTPQPPAPARRSPLVVAGVGLATALVLAGSFVAGRTTAPATAPVASTLSPAGRVSSATGWTVAGTTLTGPNFRATLPAGWMFGPKSYQVTDNSGSLLTYFEGTGDPGAALCASTIEAYRKENGGTVVDRPSVPWGPDTAVVKELDFTDNSQAVVVLLYCLTWDGTTAPALRSMTISDDGAGKAAAESVLASWTWT